MNAVVTTLVILVAAVVLGTGVVLYGTSLFNESTNDSSSKIPIYKQMITYHKEGVDPLIKMGYNTTKSFIVAIDSLTWKFLLSNGETIDSLGTAVFFIHSNGFQTTYYDGNDINDVIGSKVLVTYSNSKYTCDYVFDWGNNFHSKYNVKGFNFTQIPNATNYDFVQNGEYGNSCSDTVKNIEKVEVFVK